jgi:anti-sigma regulatory factor (Ser/Thr protein kinase)
MFDLEERPVATQRWRGAARTAVIDELHADVMAFARRHRMAEAPLRDLGVAVWEALVNAVRHAYRDTEPGDVELDVATDGECLTVRVADHGAGAGGRPYGLGAQIMRGLSDRLEIGPMFGGPGTVVLMEFGIGGRATL